MRKRILSLLLALVLVLGMVPVVASADEVPSVTVYLSMSSDDEFLTGTETNSIMALKPIKVPYFDIGPYGLSDLYFSSEEYGDDGDGNPGSDLVPGTKEYAYGKITMLHLFIYATERYELGWSEEDCGQGKLYSLGYMGSDVHGDTQTSDHLLYVSGTVGSIFMNQVWGVDMNLNYYLNYEYPTASVDENGYAWGATADQILLEDGDIITMGHFENCYEFYTDPYSIFNYITSDKKTVTQGEQVEMQVLHAGPNLGGSSGTAQTPVETCPNIFYCKTENIYSSDVTEWIYAKVSADENGYFMLDTSNMETGTYMIAVPGLPGESTDDIVSTPGGMLLTVTAPSAPLVVLGDVNGDTEVTAMDVSLTAQKAAGKEVTITTAAADVNGDNAITAMDVSLIAQFAAGKITQFPAEANN